MSASISAASFLEKLFNSTEPTADGQNIKNTAVQTQTESRQTRTGEDYIVKPGDTLSRIAEKKGIAQQTILRDNPAVKNPNRIYVGEHLKLSSGNNKTIPYTVKSGDSLSEIAKKHQTTVGDILRANPKQIAKPNLIYPGQKLNIPIGKGVPAQQPKQSPPTHTPGAKNPAGTIATEPKMPKVENKPTKQPEVTQPANKPETTTVKASPHLKLKNNSVHLSPLVSAKMSQIADEYFRRTGKDLILTDGNRTPHDQAERIYDKIQHHGENIYTNKAALAEIKAAYNEGAKRGESREQIVSRMSRAIQNQVNGGTYISKHLSGQGADVRIKYMSPSDREAFKQSVAKIGGARILNEGDHWHVEVAGNSTVKQPQEPVSQNPITPPITAQQPNIASKTGELKLGVNEEYRDALLLAQKRTGIDAAALASVINAEAAVNQNGKWLANSQAPKGTARGLTQFLAGTWIERAKVRGSYLNEVALQKGFIREERGQIVVVDEKSLLALRDNPTASIVTAAEYGRDNLATLDRNGFLPKNINDDQRAKLMYYAHHEGTGGAARVLTDARTVDEQSARRVFAINGKSKLGETLKNQYGSYAEAYKYWAESEGKRIFPSQTGTKTIDAYVQKHGNYEQGYRNWLFDYSSKKIRPEIYRQ